MDQLKRCYIDCTYTFNSDLNTGIQRVVWNIISRLEHMDAFPGYRFIPVITFGSEVYRLKPDIGTSYRITRQVLKLLGNLRDMVDSVVGGAERSPVSQYAVDQSTPGSPSPAATDIRSRLHAALVSGCRQIIPSLIKLSLVFDTTFFGDTEVVVQKGDIFLFADSFWNDGDLRPLYNVKASHATTLLLVYDIIPITHPHFVDDRLHYVFSTMLSEYLKVVDGVISISRAAMEETAEYYRALNYSRLISFDYFHLGADFTSGRVRDKASNPALRAVGTSTFFLMVGSLEPRKNHAYVLDAFERLWQEGSNLTLCIVGKISWESEGLLKRMTESSYYNDRLFVFTSVNDADLSYLMRRSCALVQASLAEGFGLPLVEAMYLRKTVLASDIPVFREIGGSYPVYFPLDDSRSLSEIIRAVSEGTLKSDSSAATWLSWDESIQMLVRKIVCMAETLAGREEAGNSLERDKTCLKRDSLKEENTLTECAS